MRDTIDMAREAGFDPHDMSADFTCNLKDIEAFAELVRADEREACAQVCDEQVERSLAAIEKSKRITDQRIYRAAAQTATWNAAAIRARGISD